MPPCLLYPFLLETETPYASFRFWEFICIVVALDCPYICVVKVHMVWKKFSVSILTEMGCCSCFGFWRKSHRTLGSIHDSHGRLNHFLLPDNSDVVDGVGDTATMFHTDGELQRHHIKYEEILSHRIQSGMICREVPVKETLHLTRSKDETGNKMVNEYVHEGKIGAGSYGKVVLYRSVISGKQYAIKAFHKSHLIKLRVAPSETAMTDVLREVSIMKMLDHPNIVNLIEVIDDPNTDHFYMVMEYVEGKWVCEGSGPPGGIGESTARRYLRDIVAGLMYLHAHNIVHGDIKPDNLLVTSTGTAKIGDFSVSQVFEVLTDLEFPLLKDVKLSLKGQSVLPYLQSAQTLDCLEGDDDVLQRSPGTPVFTAPECCLGLTYRGRAADIWALGVTLYCMVLGEYPFLGDTLQDTYNKIVQNPLFLPDSIDLHLKNLLEALLCKDPQQRIVLDAVRVHPWVVGEEGPVPMYLCRCKRKSFQGIESTQSANGAFVRSDD